MYLVKSESLNLPPRRLTWYLAVEEYIASHIRELVPSSSSGIREAFFTWQALPAVIFGRNQVMEAEVNLGFCKDRGIDIVRRKSGGGCVYSDQGNIMMSFISDQTGVETVFSNFINRVVAVLRNLGVDAVSSGRNDILVGGRKVSGNAFEILPDASIVHGTLLFNIDMDSLESAITPSSAKITSKGVKSVRQHVANLSEFLPDTHPQVIRSILETSLCHESVILPDDAIDAIREIEKSYLDENFINGKNHQYSEEKHFIIKGIGEFYVRVWKEGGIIQSINLSGDYFSTADPQEELEKLLRGTRDEINAAKESLKDFNLENYVPGLSTELFVNELYSN